MFCFTHGLSSTSVLFCPSIRGPKETSWSWSDVVSLLRLWPSDAGGGEGENINNHTHTQTCDAQGDDLLTNDGTTLCTVNIVCADLHPAIEVHLRERLHSHHRSWFTGFS